MSVRPRDFRPGERLTADALNEIRAELARLSRFTFVPPLGGAVEQGGVAVWASLPWSGWVKLTSHGTGGNYAWTEQVEMPGGAWSNGPGSGTTSTDPAVEVAATATVPLSPNPIVRAWRDPGSGKLFFQMSTC